MTYLMVFIIGLMVGLLFAIPTIERKKAPPVEIPEVGSEWLNPPFATPEVVKAILSDDRGRTVVLVGRPGTKIWDSAPSLEYFLHSRIRPAQEIPR